jgi:hypothetical protein
MQLFKNIPAEIPHNLKNKIVILLLCLFAPWACPFGGAIAFRRDRRVNQRLRSKLPSLTIY